MLQIAICDNDKMTTTFIEELILNIQKERHIALQCDIFFDGSTFIQAIEQKNDYDLIYLDIQMKQMNGIRTAEQIRKMGLSPLIIYISSYETYAKELFHTEPFRFLSKPIKQSSFEAAFMDAYERILQRNTYFPFIYNKTYKKIPLKDIYYFESQKRLIYIHLKQHTEKFYEKMDHIETQLSNKHHNFLRIHQSYLVNFDYIQTLTFHNVTLVNGIILPISSGRKKHLRKQFLLDMD